jgi:small-conductance mechanosensitive channel
MEPYKLQLIESAVTLLVYLLTRYGLRHIIRLTVLRSYFKMAERKEVGKLINLILVVITIIVLVSIWSVKQENVLFFVSSLLTVFGVAMFAEMSILSNITACLILFFQHPIKIGDSISVNFEGHHIEGEIADITYFFVFIRARDGAMHTVPNALLIKSSFTLLEKKARN